MAAGLTDHVWDTAESIALLFKMIHYQGKGSAGSFPYPHLVAIWRTNLPGPRPTLCQGSTAARRAPASRSMRFAGLGHQEGRGGPARKRPIRSRPRRSRRS